MTENLEQLHERLKQTQDEIGKVIIGQSEVVDLALVTILTRGHALLEGVPGLAKTLLVRCLAEVLGTSNQRIQFTPDLMPSDITGTRIFNLQTQAFDLVKGPIFTSFLLGDEINRAPAKTQSALLQAMQERKVTIDRETYTLSEDFTVFATQNPVEYEGTYPLPEAQKDRFLLKINLSYLDREGELSLAQSMLGDNTPEKLVERNTIKSVFQPGELAQLQHTLQALTVRPELIEYMVDIVRTTRTHETLLMGAGPRAIQAMVLATRALAAIRGRDYVTPDDVHDLALPILNHRIILRPEYEIEGMTTEEIIGDILNTLPVPR